MITIIFADMLQSARVWLGALIVVAIAAFAVTVPATLTETGIRGGTLTSYALIAIAATIIVLTTIATTVVLGSVLKLTVALRRRSYALWQTIGISPARVRAVVLAQLLVVSAIGATIGSLLGAAVLPGLAENALKGSNGVDAFHLVISPGTAVIVGVVVVVISLGVGGSAARRASRTRPLEVLRESPTVRRPRLWPRWVGAAIVIALIVQMLSGLATSAVNGSGSSAILIGPLLVAVTAILGPLIFPRVMRWWTSVIPPTASASWYIARANTVYAVDRSSTVIASLLVAVALPGSFSAGQGTLSDAMAIMHGTDAPQNPGGTLLLILGGPVLLAAAGAAAATVMSSGVRAREGALLSAAGAPPGFSLSTALWEGIIQVGTSMILAIMIVVVTAVAEGSVLASVAPGVSPDFAYGSVVATFVITAVGILVATLVPTLATKNQIIPSALNGE